MPENKLYYGDNLEVLRRYVKEESVDLVYLDPPFNSRQDYNVLFAEKDGTRAASQIKAFEDTWEWNAESKRVYEELVERGDRVSDVMRAFHTFLLNSDMMNKGGISAARHELETYNLKTSLISGICIFATLISTRLATR